MGLGASAYLVFGVPVEIECGEASEHWSEENEDWRDLDGELEYLSYGHYMDSDYRRAILTSTRIPNYHADCWDPTEISAFDGLSVSDKAISKSADQCRMAGLSVDFLDAKWCLVASYG